MLRYDALVLAMGARMRPAFGHALTIDDRRIDEQLHGLIQDVEGGYVHSIAFLAPAAMAWPLPLYELALMTARRAYDMQSDVSITLVTPEPAPLAAFGAEVSRGIEQLLERNEILTITSAHCSVPAAGRVLLDHDGRTVRVDRTVALPELVGPSTPGVPGRAPRGFITVDAHCQVKGFDDVFAAGDATDFPIKHGSIAAQQADAAAQAIVAAAGLPIEPRPLVPELRAVLLGADKPLYLSATVTGGHGLRSTMGTEPTWTPVGKISGRYLTPYLESFQQRGASEPVGVA